MDTLKRRTLEEMGGEEHVVRGDAHDIRAKQLEISKEQNNVQADVNSENNPGQNEIRVQALQELANMGKLHVSPEEIQAKMAEIESRREAA